jgi:hypothetical protein
MEFITDTSGKLLKEASLLHQKTRASVGRCLIFLKVAYERFKDLTTTDLVVAAEKYFEYMKNRQQPSGVNLIQAQLYSLMLAYL